MPIPGPSKKDDQNTYVSRCIKHLADKGEFADNPSQRVAVCEATWKRAKAQQVADDLAAALMDKKCKDCKKSSTDCTCDTHNMPPDEPPSDTLTY